jgi:hypothetical protein
MSGISVCGAGSAKWKGATAGFGLRKGYRTTAGGSRKPAAGDGPRAPRGGWLINRVLCAVMGHRRLLPTAAAEKLLPGGVRRELFMCHACDGYAWKSSSTNYRPSWSELAV